MISALVGSSVSASASQLAYSLVLSFVPLIMFVLTAAIRFDLPVEDVFRYLKFILPSQAFSMVEGVLLELTDSGNWTVYTLFTSIYFVSIGMRGIINISAKIYDDEKRRNIAVVWISSFVMAALLLVTIIVSFVLIVFGDYIAGLLKGLLNIRFTWIITVIRYVTSYLLTGAVVSLLYSAAGGRRRKFKDIRLGAYIASALWIIASTLFAYYVNNFSNFGLLFGSLGGLFILLVWLYWSSLMLVLGLYINYVNMKMKKRR